jgi:DNA-binding LacI/PurR family transcriptional regulator
MPRIRLAATRRLEAVGAMTRPAKRITSSDVARAAGVSQTTVSFVLNDKPGHSIPAATRLRILEVARQLDYRPHACARTLAAGRSDVVLLSVPEPLTTVGIDLRQAGRARAEMIVASLAGREPHLGAAQEGWKVIPRSSA